jgi:hypothetical protein
MGERSLLQLVCTRKLIGSLSLLAATMSLLAALGPADAASVTIAAAGDIACAPTDTENPCVDEQTAALLSGAAQVLALGDLQYESGELTAFQQVYDKSWGQYKSITLPAVGNHEYRTADADGYRAYWGYSSSQPLYYSTTIGSWHVVAIDSNCGDLPRGSGPHGCAPGSPQYEWLQSTLATNAASCQLAFWHHPAYSSESTSAELRPIQSVFASDGGDVVLNGHAHNYQRIVTGGLTQIVVGTGGKSLRLFDRPAPAGTQFQDATHFGVVRMSLDDAGYSGQFVATDGSIPDSFSGGC